METFGKRLAKLRKKRGLTQEEFARQLKISKSTLGMYEIDQREPNFETLIMIVNYFDVTTDYLIMGKEKETN